MELFNFVCKVMGVVVKDCEIGKLCVYWKGVFEIILQQCDKIIDVDGNIVFLDEVKMKEIRGVIYIMVDDVL